ncbi:MAG: ABC transporter ATP-binding protein [Nocardioidaceae bacterium]
MEAITSAVPTQVLQPPALAAHDLYRFYRAGDEETLALKGVSISLSPGELTAVVGPSGSGKSTLLNLLAGLDEPSGGTVWVAGERVSHRPEPVRAALRARLIGVLRQSNNLLGHLTVRENIDLVARLQHAKGDRRALLESLGMSARSESLPHQLSGGEAARAGMAVALAADPPVLLADEPTGELDGDTEMAVLALLRERAERGGAVLIASHSPAVRRLADRVIELADGQVVS